MRKLSNRKGFTLAEVLIATAILAIFVSMAIVGTSALFGTGEEMMAVSKAAVLGSDVMKTVTNEVRFGEEFSLQGKKITYNSTAYGDDCEISIDEAGQLIIVQTSSSTDSFGNVTSDQKTFFPIGSAAYDEVYIKSIEFTIKNSEKNKSRQIITCTLSITSDGEHTLWEKTMTAVPISQKTV